MITEPNYKYATNAAYQELFYYNGSFPQINIYDLLFESGDIILKSYTQAANYLNCPHNEFTYNIAQSEFGFTVSDLKSGNHIIYFNNLKDEKTIRFTLAHELGHIRLGHIVDNDVSDKEANCFARNILCPVQIIRELNLSTAEDYAECFGISIPMAEVSIAHYKSDCYYITTNNYQFISDKIYCYMTGYSLSEIYGCWYLLYLQFLSHTPNLPKFAKFIFKRNIFSWLCTNIL